MKKILFMVAAVALAMVSCNKEEITNNEIQEAPVSDIVFEAETPMTKTTIGEADANGIRPVSWVVGDRITINGSEFKASELKDNKAIFVTENLDFTTAESYDAIYPATAGTSLSAVTISAKQDGTFANASISVAQSETQSLSFKNVASMLKFQVPASASEVTIESTSNLAGTFAVTFDGEGNPVIGEVSNGSKKITLTGSFVVATDYYVAILPGDHKFTVKIDGYTSKESTKISTVARAKLMNMKTIPQNVYLHAKTSKYDWTSDGARFATWTWGTGVADSWFDMVAEGHDGVYRLEVPTGYNNIIFCRMSGTVLKNDWANVWNQTGDLTIPTDNANHFYISDSGAGTWGDKDYTFPVVKPKDGYLYLKPSSEWMQANAHFAAWIWKDNGAGKVYNFKPHESVPGLYEINLNGANKMILFRMDPKKKVTDGSTAWPGDNHWYKSGDLKITGNLYTVVGWQAAGTGFSTVTEL